MRISDWSSDVCSSDLEGQTPFGIHVLVGQSHTIFMADTTVNERPTAEKLADIAEGTAAVARRMGHEPRVAFLSYSTFGNPEGKWLDNIRDAVKLIDERGVSFEYEGEIGRASCREIVCKYV